MICGGEIDKVEEATIADYSYSGRRLRVADIVQQSSHNKRHASEWYLVPTVGER